MISNRMSKAYSEWKSNQDTQPFNENIEKEYQKLLETLSPEQEEVLTKYCDEIFASGAETEEFFYRLGIKDGLRLRISRARLFNKIPSSVSEIFFPLRINNVTPSSSSNAAICLDSVGWVICNCSAAFVKLCSFATVRK